MINGAQKLQTFSQNHCVTLQEEAQLLDMHALARAEEERKNPERKRASLYT